MRARSGSGFSATTIWIVEQFGLAMMLRFWYCAMASGLTSGTTSGTSGSIRQREVLSMTIAPALAARGANSPDTLAPGDDSTMSVPLKSNASSAWTCSTSSSPNDTSRPSEAEEASATTSSAGKLRSAKVASISRPTLPVAPTTATLKPICGNSPMNSLGGDEVGWECAELLTYDAGWHITSGRWPSG